MLVVAVLALFAVCVVDGVLVSLLLWRALRAIIEVTTQINLGNYHPANDASEVFDTSFSPFSFDLRL